MKKSEEGLGKMESEHSKKRRLYTINSCNTTIPLFFPACLPHHFEKSFSLHRVLSFGSGEWRHMALHANSPRMFQYWLYVKVPQAPSQNLLCCAPAWAPESAQKHICPGLASLIYWFLLNTLFFIDIHLSPPRTQDLCTFLMTSSFIFHSRKL